MVTTSNARPLVLVAAAQERSLAAALEGDQYAVVEVHSGTLAVKWTPELQPDIVILEADLPDMAGIDACRLLHSDPLIGHNVPILILVADNPTPEQRVTALRAGAWDFLRYPRDPEDLLLKLQTYVQAKRNIDVALAEGLVDPTTGLHTRVALARRARELGALMSRAHGALACVVFTLENESVDPKTGSVMVRTTRVSDVVGALGPREFAVLAPGTDHSGAVTLAQRVGAALCAVPGGGGRAAPTTLRAGYDAVGNLTYSPTDPVELLMRAATAVHSGTPEPGYPWVRRFAVGTAASQARGPTSRPSPSGLVLEKRRPSE